MFLDGQLLCKILHIFIMDLIWSSLRWSLPVVRDLPGWSLHSHLISASKLHEPIADFIVYFIAPKFLPCLRPLLSLRRWNLNLLCFAHCTSSGSTYQSWDCMPLCRYQYISGDMCIFVTWYNFQCALIWNIHVTEKMTELLTGPDCLLVAPQLTPGCIANVCFGAFP